MISQPIIVLTQVPDKKGQPTSSEEGEMWGRDPKNPKFRRKADIMVAEHCRRLEDSLCPCSLAV